MTLVGKSELEIVSYEVRANALEEDMITNCVKKIKSPLYSLYDAGAFND